MLTPWYCSREDVMAALGKLTARDTAQVDIAVAAATDSIEELTGREFYPTYATRYFDFPDFATASRARLWLDGSDLLDVDTFESAGSAVTDYFLYPANSLPYDRIETDKANLDSFNYGDTSQRSIAITGTFGYTNAEILIGELVAGINASVSFVKVSDASKVGVGNQIRIGSERMIITEKNTADSGETTVSNLTANVGNVAVTVTDGSVFNLYDVIIIDEEQLLIVSISGDDLTVKRAWNGSVLAAHATSSIIYTLNLLTVQRASTGTTAASHSTSDPVYLLTPPAIIRELCIGEAVNNILQNQGGYSRDVGSDQNQRGSGGRGLKDLRARVQAKYYRWKVGAA